MEDENIINDNIEAERQVPAPLEPLQILVTEEDMSGTDILAMSDFLDGCIEEMVGNMRGNVISGVTVDVPVSDIAIIGEVVHYAKTVTQGMVQYIPDFDHLPKDIKEKFDQGLLKIGESRQVEGNVRAVLVDREGTRVKDVTLKEVHLDPGLAEASRSIANQIQMKSISSKLAAIEAKQSYQIARDRDRDIYVPVLDARESILLAQLENESEEKRMDHLREASKLLRSALTSIYRDIDTTKDSLVKETKRFLFFRNQKTVDEFISYVSTDLQIVHKIVGLNVRVLGYLGDKNSIMIETERYKKCMLDFFSRELPECKCTLAELIQDNVSYRDENMDCWYNLSVEVKKPLAELEKKGMEHIYLVSMEDVEDGGERE